MLPPFRGPAAVSISSSTRSGDERFRGRELIAAMIVGVGLLTASCSGKADVTQDTLSAPGARVLAAPAVPSLPECPNTTGKWDECNVRQRLERAGLAPQPIAGALRQPFLGVPGIRYRVGRAELQVFLYDNAAALARDLARVDTLRVQGRDTTVTWSATPTLITSNNLAAILLSDQGTQIERVRLALTAGLPAPDTTKKKK